MKTIFPRTTRWETFVTEIKFPFWDLFDTDVTITFSSPLFPLVPLVQTLRITIKKIESYKHKIVHF